MNEAKRKLLGGGRANPRATIGRKAKPTRYFGSNLILAALKVWELRNGKKSHPFNAYHQPEKGETS